MELLYIATKLTAVIVGMMVVMGEVVVMVVVYDIFSF